MLELLSTTTAIMAGAMRNEDDIVPFGMQKTWDEGTAEDKSTIEDATLHQRLP